MLYFLYEYFLFKEYLSGAYLKTKSENWTAAVIQRAVKAHKQTKDATETAVFHLS